MISSREHADFKQSHTGFLVLPLKKKGSYSVLVFSSVGLTAFAVVKVYGAFISAGYDSPPEEPVQKHCFRNKLQYSNSQ